MMEYDARDLDNYITGHYGEDQYGAEYQENEFDYDRPEDLDEPDPGPMPEKLERDILVDDLENTKIQVSAAWEEYNNRARCFLLVSGPGLPFNETVWRRAEGARQEWMSWRGEMLSIIRRMAEIAGR